MSKYDDLQKILRWCKAHNMRDFSYYDVGVPSQSINALCNKYRGREWVTCIGTDQGVRRYALSENGAKRVFESPTPL